MTEFWDDSSARVLKLAVTQKQRRGPCHPARSHLRDHGLRCPKHKPNKRGNPLQKKDMCSVLKDMATGCDLVVSRPKPVHNGGICLIPLSPSMLPNSGIVASSIQFHNRIRKLSLTPFSPTPCHHPLSNPLPFLPTKYLSKSFVHSPSPISKPKLPSLLPRPLQKVS